MNSMTAKSQERTYGKDSYYDGLYDEYKDDRREENDKEGYLGEIYDYSCIPESVNREEYSKLEEQGYRSVLNSPLSTFAADVDTASYSNLRRMLNDGYSIYNLPNGSVRVEELINYFNYDYSGPRGSEPFGVNTMISDCPWNSRAKLLSIGLKTEDIDFADTPASNLVFLIDVSGSMSDYDKLPLLQEAFGMLTDELTDKDRVSIVTYANGVDTVLEGARGNDSRRIKRVLNNLFASGGTNGGAGIETAYKLAEKNFIKGGNNRVILATDGDLNLGVTSVGGLEELISMKKESGVYLSVLGFGTGNLKDNRMETLADKGNGNYAYIDSVREARKVLIDELSSNMLTVCKDVKLQVEFNPAYVKGYRLVGYANRTMAAKDFNNDKKDGGEIGAGHEVTALYELILNDEYEADDTDIDGLRYADEFRKASGKSSKRNRTSLDRNSELLTLSIRYKKPSENKSKLLTYPVTFACYTDSPSNDFMFQSAVAEFGLIASNSEYMGNADIHNVIETLDTIRLDDEYKQEFKDLVEYALAY
ncbi:MAG: VWA domain-containing protein [Lachnospiraceae bacterium]|nr:VWA domain-containing protein [Lachnospiraceae bacterium]